MEGGLAAVGTRAAGADADGLWREKMLNGFDLLDIDAVVVVAAVAPEVEGVDAFTGERRAGRRARAFSCSLV